MRTIKTYFKRAPFYNALTVQVEGGDPPKLLTTPVLANFRFADHPPGTVQSAKYVAQEMSLNASLLDVVQFKGHRLEVYGDALSLSKKVDPQIAIEPFAFGPLLGLKNMGRLKSNGLSAEF